VLGNHDTPRVASRVGLAQARVAAMLLLTLPGTPVLYQGDELGLGDMPVPPEEARDPIARLIPGHSRDPQRTLMPEGVVVELA
jgi:alpha-glucosidase